MVIYILFVQHKPSEQNMYLLLSVPPPPQLLEEGNVSQQFYDRYNKSKTIK